MSKQTRALGYSAIVLVLVSTLSWLALGPVFDRKPEASPDLSPDQSEFSESVPAQDSGFQTDSAPTTNSQPSRVAIGDKHGRTTAEEPAGSRSEGDSEWLRRHLYPTMQELDAARDGLDSGSYAVPKSSQELASAAHSIYREADREVAEDQLLSAADLGSIYALIAIGDYYQSAFPVVSVAYYRAAVMRGDWTAALRPRNRDLNHLEDGLASLKALQILEGIDQRRAQAGLPPLRREVRPGLDEFAVGLEITIEEINRPSE